MAALLPFDTCSVIAVHVLRENPNKDHHHIHHHGLVLRQDGHPVD